MKRAADILCERLHETIVKVSVIDAVGTGFWVGPGLIVTCAHVVSSAHANGAHVEINWGGNCYNAKVVDHFEEEDVALLQCTECEAIRHPIAILASEYSVGDDLYSFGFSEEYPNGEPVTSVVEGASVGPTLIKLKNGQVVPGFSGAPTLNRRTGAVCGVVRRTRDKTSDLGGRAVPVAIVLTAFPEVAEIQREFRKAETEWSQALSADQKKQLGISYHITGILDRIAEIYTLLHYTVQRDVTVSGHFVDLLLERRVADITIHRVVFMWDENAGVNQLEKIAVKVSLINGKKQGITGSVVYPGLVEHGLVEQATSFGIKLITLADLESQLFDATGYVNKLIRETEDDPRYSLERFVEPRIGESLFSSGQLVRSFVQDWMENGDEKQLTVLGNTGTGKTFLSMILAYEAALEFRKNPGQARWPVRIDLRSADRQFTLEGLFLTHFAKNEMRDLSFDLFRHAVRSGRVLIILDGFDEMSAKVTPQITAKNFQELARIVEGGAKVILTCRTHYFRSRSDEAEVVFGDQSSYGSESARELYWDLIARQGFRIAYLQEFDFSQIEEYVERVKKNKASEAIKKIKGIYNLVELCQRPMLLEMIVKSIGKLDTNSISAAALYQVFTDTWIHRDRWRDTLTSAEKYEFSEGLACQLTVTNEDSIHYSLLAGVIKGGVALSISDPRRLVEIDSDIRTSNFLTRDEDGNYGFGHKSYREFFYARAVRTGLLQCSFDLIAKQRLSPEEVGFTVDLLNMAPDSLLGVISTLEGILTKEYRRFVSENALLILIAIRRGPIWERSERVASVKLPDCMQLQGAILNQVDLRGVTAVAADLSGADLSESVLSQCVLANAKAVNTRFVSSVLSYSHWSNGDFHNANFTSANLNKASFVFASLRGCLFHNTAVVDVNVAGANLSNINYDGVLLGDGVVAKGAGYLPLLEFLSVREEMQWNLNDLLSDPVFLREVQSVVSRVTGERRDCDGSEDVVQSILLEVLMGREKLRFLNRRKLLDYIKWSASRFAGSRMFWSSRLDGDANAVLHAPEPFVRPSGLDGEAVSFEARALRKGLGLMGSMERQIVERKLEGRSNIEIASELRCSVHSVHRRWSMIRDKLHRCLLDVKREEGLV